MHLHDSTIAHIAKVVQLAIITGTDVIDHLRMMKLDVNDLEGLIYIDLKNQVRNVYQLERDLKQIRKTN